MITQTALAAHIGVSKMTISKGVKRGRLTKSVIRDPETGAPIGITSLEEGAAEWRANADYTDAPHLDPANKRPAGTDGEELNAVQRKNHYEAELKRLKFQEAEGELINAAEAKREWVEVLSRVRTRLLSIPTFYKQHAPSTPLEDIAALEALVRDALSELSEGKA